MTLPRLRIRSLARLALAHHPGCHPFRDDVFRIGRLSFCVGCWTTWPVALGGLALLVHLAPAGWAAWLLGGLALCSLQLLSSGGWTDGRPRKVAVKASLGLGGAAALYGIVSAPVPPGVRIALLGACLLAAGLTLIPRSRRLVRTCEGCFFKGDWERCPGMALVRPS